jgi:hypothetical protein
MHLTRLALTALTVAVVTLLTSPASAGACDHPYFPIKQGQKLVYDYPGAGMQVTMVVSKVEGNNVTWDVTTSIRGGGAPVSTVVHGECTAQGYSTDADAAHGAHGARTRVLSRTGTQFGPSSQMKVGGTWTSGTTSESEAPNMTVHTETSSTSKVVAKERVKVPAGDYQALRIDSVMEMKSTMSGPNAAKMAKAGFGTINVKSTMWIAEGVGLVKSQSVADDGAISPGMELVSFQK